ncbi:MAG: redoxin domain-containing protein, partial [Bacteroidaceae bacterium]|nr:redoxin domain-containing protein [Bacteroidaceae bacterium]
IAVLPLAFASCESEVMEELTPMCQMYNESVNLPQATLDSITNFTHKFGGYVGSHPESRQDKYFDPTLQNLRDAAALYVAGHAQVKCHVEGILETDAWGDEVIICEAGTDLRVVDEPRFHVKAMIPVYEKYKDKGFTVVAIAREQKADAMQKAMKRDGYPWPSLLELNDENHVWRKNGADNSGGATFLIDRDGTILSTSTNAEELEPLIKAAIERE